MSISIRDFERLKKIEDFQVWACYDPDGTKTEIGRRSLTAVDYYTIKHVGRDIIDSVLRAKDDVLEGQFKLLIDSEIDLINKMEDINEAAYLIFLRMKEVEVNKALVVLGEIYANIPPDWEDELTTALSNQVEMIHSIALERCASNALKKAVPNHQSIQKLNPDFDSVREHPMIIQERPSLERYL